MRSLPLPLFRRRLPMNAAICTPGCWSGTPPQNRPVAAFLQFGQSYGSGEVIARNPGLWAQARMLDQRAKDATGCSTCYRSGHACRPLCRIRRSATVPQLGGRQAEAPGCLAHSIKSAMTSRLINKRASRRTASRTHSARRRRSRVPCQRQRRAEQENRAQQETPRMCGLLGFPFRSKSNSRLLLGGGLGCDGSLVLSDAAWERMAPLIIGRPDQKGSTGRDNGCSWKGCCGSCAPDPLARLPEAFGDWNSVFRRFSRWSIKGVW